MKNLLIIILSLIISYLFSTVIFFVGNFILVPEIGDEGWGLLAIIVIALVSTLIILISWSILASLTKNDPVLIKTIRFYFLKSQLLTLIFVLVFSLEFFKGSSLELISLFIFVLTYIYLGYELFSKILERNLAIILGIVYFGVIGSLFIKILSMREELGF